MPAKIGRPEAEIDYDQLHHCASRCYTQAGAAAFLGISRATFTNRMRDDAKFRETWEAGQGMGHNSLRETALDILKRRGEKSIASATTVLIHMLKHQLGEKDKSVIEHANKDGKPLEVRVSDTTECMGVDIQDATDEELEALALVAAAQERQREARAAEAARDITGEATEGP